MRAEFTRANEELLKLKAQIALKEQEEEKKIEEHRKKKEALDHLKKTKEEERFREKQAIK